MQQSFLFIPFFVSFLVTVFVIPFLIRLLPKYGLMDNPNRKHPGILHTKPIPRGGGIALFIGVWVAGLFLLPHTKITFVLFVASVISLAVGVVDDKLGDTSRILRLLIYFFAAILVVGSGISVSYITNPLGGILHLDYLRLSFHFLGTHSVLLFSDIIAVIWIVWVMNMLNWSSGVDGQMPGIVAIAAFVIGLLALRFPLTDPQAILTTKLSFMIAGASLGFLLFNFYPAKIFPGDGSMAIYLLLAVVAILSGAKLATAILVMGVPMMDGGVTVLRRLAKKQSPFKGDRKHLHHLLLNRGLSHKQIALFYWAVSAILGLIALTVPSNAKAFAIIMLLTIVGGGLLFFHLTVQEQEIK